MEQGLSKNSVIAELTRSPHGELKEFLAIGREAVKADPSFFAHLISWNRSKGQVRDSKVALPVISLMAPALDQELLENSLAHMVMLRPKEFLRAVKFAKEIRPIGKMHAVRRLVQSYLRELEANPPKFDRVAVQHRVALKNLYSLVHVKPSERANIILYGRDLAKRKQPYPVGSIFESVAQLATMSPAEAAGTIINRRIPFLIAMGVMGERNKEVDIALALLTVASPNEVVSHVKMFEKLGVKTNPVLRGAYEKALGRLAESKTNTFKATKAIEAVEDEELQEKLRGIQDKQIQKIGGVDGNWLVLGDRSPSMQLSIELSKEVAGTLAKMVKGKVWLVFFDAEPMTIDVSGLSFDEVKKATRHINTTGSGTSIGCGLQRMIDAKEDIDGVAIVSDGGENTSPRFPDCHKRYEQLFGKELPVYLYLCAGDTPRLINDMQVANRSMQVFDLRQGKVDYYSLPNLVQTMRTNRYSLIDEIMETRLLKLADVFKTQDSVEVVSQI